MVIAFSHPSSFLNSEDQIDKNIDTGGDEKRITESLFGSNNSYSSYSDIKSNRNYRGRDPFDLIPGDIVFNQEYWKNFLLIGMGGINKLKVSNKNFFMQNLIDNKATLMAGNLDIITDFGVFKFDNTDDKVKLSLKADREFNKKVQQGLFDINLEIGACDDGNTVSFKYKTEKNNEPYIFTIDTKGRVFKNIPSDSVEIYNENKIESIAENRAIAVQKNFDIDVSDTLNFNTTKDGSINLGAEGLNELDNEIVRRPHVESRYKPLIEKMADALMKPPPLDVPGLPLMLRSSELLELYIECMIQKPQVMNDMTKFTRAK